MDYLFLIFAATDFKHVRSSFSCHVPVLINTQKRATCDSCYMRARASVYIFVFLLKVFKQNGKKRRKTASKWWMLSNLY